MIYLDKFKGAGTCSSCSNQANFKLNIGKSIINLCDECSDYLVNRLHNLTEIEVDVSTVDKSYKRDVYKANFKVWNNEELELLKTTSFTPKEISEELGRTVAAVRTKLRKLGIRPNL